MYVCASPRLLDSLSTWTHGGGGVGWGGVVVGSGAAEGKPLPPTRSLTPVRARVHADANKIAPVERLGWFSVG